MAAQVPNIFVEQYDQGQRKIRADLMDENFAYVCTQLDANADTGSAAQTAADNAQTAADAAQNTADSKVTAAQAAHAAMPSGQYIDLTVPANNGTITSPADGWVFFSRTATNAGQYIALAIVDGTTDILASGEISYANNNGLTVTIPVSTGDVVRVGYQPSTTAKFLRFIYANGSAPTV